jgi:hypothetical protein
LWEFIFSIVYEDDANNWASNYAQLSWLKVVKVTQERHIFKMGFLGGGGLIYCNFNLSFLIAHGLKVVRVKGLCLVNVELFYTNLKQRLLPNVGSIH